MLWVRKEQFVICLFGAGVPVPGVFEGGYLRIGLGAEFVFEEDAIVSVRVERRIEIDEIYARGLDVFPQDL